MRFERKKLTALGLAAAMLCPVLSVGASEPTAYTGFTCSLGEENFLSDSKAWKQLQENGNISIELTEVPRMEVSEKLGLLFAGNDYPDFVFKNLELDINMYSSEGILIPLEDLIKENMPNLTAILDERNAWGEITESDGHIYSLPYLGDQGRGSGMEFFVNKKWLDNVGLEEPTNGEEFYNVLKAFKEQDADGDGDTENEIPFIFAESWYPLQCFFEYWGGGLVNGSNVTRLKDGKLEFFLMTEEYKDFLALMAKAYSEGLIYKDVFTFTHEDMLAMIKSGSAIGVLAALSFPDDEISMEYVPLQPLGEDKKLRLTSGVTKGCMVVTDQCEEPAALLAAMDWLYTEEGSIAARLGYEGETYTLNDKGEWSTIDGVNLSEYVINGQAPWPGKEADLMKKLDSELDPKSAYLNEVGTASKETYGEVYPTLTMTDEEKDIESKYMSDITAYWKNYMALVISGAQDLEETWDEYIATLEKMHVAEVYGAYDAAYQRELAK